MRIDNSGNSSALIVPDPVACQFAVADAALADADAARAARIVGADAAQAARILAARRRIADGVYSSPVVLVAVARRLLSSGDL
jgi:hypothetical protein